MERINAIEKTLSDPNTWTNNSLVEQLGKEKSSLEKVTTAVEALEVKLKELTELLVLVVEEKDEEPFSP